MEITREGVESVEYGGGWLMANNGVSMRCIMHDTMTVTGVKYVGGLIEWVGVEGQRAARGLTFTSWSDVIPEFSWDVGAMLHDVCVAIEVHGGQAA